MVPSPLLKTVVFNNFVFFLFGCPLFALIAAFDWHQLWKCLVGESTCWRHIPPFLKWGSLVTVKLLLQIQTLIFLLFLLSSYCDIDIVWPIVLTLFSRVGESLFT